MTGTPAAPVGVPRQPAWVRHPTKPPVWPQSTGPPVGLGAGFGFGFPYTVGDGVDDVGGDVGKAQFLHVHTPFDTELDPQPTGHFPFIGPAAQHPVNAMLPAPRGHSSA